MKKSVVIIFITFLIIPIISFGQRVTYKSAYAFMKKRSNNVNQKLLKGYSTKFDGTKTYLFFTVPKVENGTACVSMISEYKLEVFAVDCKSYSTKKYQWLALGGPDLYPSDIDLEEDIKLISDFNQKTFKNPKERWDEYISTLGKLWAGKTAAEIRFRDKYDTYERQYKQYLDKEIGISLNEIIKKGNIKSLPNYRNTINNDVYSDELKNNYLNILENEIESFNDSIISLFTSDLENKKKESLVSHMESLIEYDNIDSLQNKINDKFQLDEPLSFLNNERFKEYLDDFIINKLTDVGTFRISKNYIYALVFSLELNEGKIKTKSATSNLLDGHTLDYKFSEDEKEQIESFILFNITPKKEFINIKTEVKLEPKNRTFIHNRKEPITLYVNKNLLDAEERSTFTGGIWKQNKIFFKSRSNSRQPITTKTFKSQKNQIKINLDDTYGLKVEKLGSNLRVDFFEDLNPYFNSADRGKAIDGYFSDYKKIVNVYTEWIYELYIGNKKVDENIKLEFSGFSPLKYLSKPTYFNKPFYTIDVYQIF
ncbi:MAG: hypothetical protein ACJ0QA_02910 [Flavobacteriaceae bacterium]